MRALQVPPQAPDAIAPVRHLTGHHDDVDLRRRGARHQIAAIHPAQRRSPGLLDVGGVVVEHAHGHGAQPAGPVASQLTGQSLGVRPGADHERAVDVEVAAPGAVEVAAPAPAAREHGGGAERERQQEVAAGDRDLQEVGGDRRRAEGQQRRVQHALVLQHPGGEDPRLPGAGGGEVEQPDQRDGGADHRVVHGDPAHLDVRGEGTEPRGLHERQGQRDRHRVGEGQVQLDPRVPLGMAHDPPVGCRARGGERRGRR